MNSGAWFLIGYTAGAITVLVGVWLGLRSGE